MPCCQVFEPWAQSGHLIISSGFSVRAEHAHQNQGRLPFHKMLGQRISSNHEHGRGKTVDTDVYFPAKKVVPGDSGRPRSCFTDASVSEGHGLNHSSKPITIQVEGKSLPIADPSHPVDQSYLLSVGRFHLRILSDFFLIPYFH